MTAASNGESSGEWNGPPRSFAGAQGKKAVPTQSGLACKIFGERIVRALFIPENTDDPPALAVVEKLKAVDAARERRFASSVARFVAAEDLSDVAKGLDAIHDRVFKETVLEEIAASARSVFIGAHGTKMDGTVGAFCGGGEARRGKEEGAEAAPVALAGRAGDDVVDRRHDAVDGVDVGGLGGRDTGEWVGGGLLGGGFVRGGLGRGERWRGKGGGKYEKCKLHELISKKNLPNKRSDTLLDAGTIYQVSRVRGENRAGSATEVGEEPEEEREGEAENEAGDDGKVKRSMLAAMDDVSGKFAESKRQFRVEIENSANNYQQAPEEKQSAAEIAERIHRRRAL